MADLVTAVERWREPLSRPLSDIEPFIGDYFQQLITLGTVDAVTANCIKQMLCGHLHVGDVNIDVFRVPIGEEIGPSEDIPLANALPGERDAQGRQVKITNPAAVPIVKQAVFEPNAHRVPPLMALSIFGHESGGRHTSGFMLGAGRQRRDIRIVTYGIDWNNFQRQANSLAKRHNFDPLFSDPARHWAFSRGYGLGAITPSGPPRAYTMLGPSGGPLRPHQVVNTTRGIPNNPQAPDVIKDPHTNMEQSVRLLKSNFRNRKITKDQRQCTFRNESGQRFDCQRCLERFTFADFEFGRGRVKTIFLKASAFDRVPEAEGDGREFPCSWFRAIMQYVGGFGSQGMGNLNKHFNNIQSGRVSSAEFIAEPAEPENASGASTAPEDEPEDDADE
ncbi:hypothetical protein HYR99_20285 [Candidatus Poribacteria bacterium]|nr:hypothetical protein [Candidatus Poribacteria bacterium]